MLYCASVGRTQFGLARHDREVKLFSRWPLRTKLLFGLVLLAVIVSVLSATALVGVYSFRSLVKGIRARSGELPLANALSRQVGDLRVTLSESKVVREFPAADLQKPLVDARILREQFGLNLQIFRRTLEQYQAELDTNEWKTFRINEAHRERETVRKIRNSLSRIEAAHEDELWMLDEVKVARLDEEVEQLQKLTAELPSYLHQRMQDFATDTRGHYHALILFSILSSILVVLLLAAFVRLAYSSVFRPIRVLVKGSRIVAAGEFDHRIQLNTCDEMSELAGAMNDMTARFQDIRDDLDRQVQIRTKQVVRSEQLASVGFLAAGVAHEINNPLASIAMCGESLASRIRSAKFEDEADAEVAGNYLSMIQEEAFRCKEITERLLDFSRMGDVKHQSTDLRELVEGVIDMVSHLGMYQEKHVELLAGEPVIGNVNAQEIKQVVLNLITNGLDSLDPGGKVTVELGQQNEQAELIFTDNGCGMTEEVMQHLFEPFFTRRRNGQGTGLGLSIVYRIIADHDGEIEVASDGPGRGSRFRVRLPMAERNQKESQNRYQAA